MKYLQARKRRKTPQLKEGKTSLAGMRGLHGLRKLVEVVMEASGMRSTENTENTWRHVPLLILPYQDIHEDISNSDVTYKLDDDKRMKTSVSDS